MIQVVTASESGSRPSWQSSQVQDWVNRALAAYPTARYLAHTAQIVCNPELNVWTHSVTVVVEVFELSDEEGITVGG
jgi:hypothetical protein